MSAIHKRSFPPHLGLPLGAHTTPGPVRTIGIDGQGDIAVWYESQPDTSHECQILWTGEEIAEGFRLIDSINYKGLVWHLAVPEHDA